ncbi:MAG: LacI family DNA-binding transcriptional regulator [Pseudomonadota bacterium]
MPRSAQKKPNVRDVARHARVSVATVSRVLNGSPLVSAATRQQVEGAIEALRFVPSSAARAINSGHTRLVGALIPTLDYSIFARFIEAVESGLDRKGLSLIVATTAHDAARELDRARKLLDIGVEGLIVSGITRAHGFDALVSRHQVPVVATSYFKADHTVPTIGYDNALLARTALDHLTSLGHREIAVLSGPSEMSDRTRARLSGLDGAGPATQHRFEMELSFSAAGVITRKVVSEFPRVSALLCLSDVLAQGALLQLRSEGIDVPSEISVVGMDNLPASESFAPPLTTIKLPVEEMGETTAEAIASWIETGEMPTSRLLEMELMVRGTTATARPALDQGSPNES